MPATAAGDPGRSAGDVAMPDVEARFRALVQSPLRAGLLRYLHWHPDRWFDARTLMATFGSMPRDVTSCLESLVAFGVARQADDGPDAYAATWPTRQATAALLRRFLDAGPSVDYRSIGPFRRGFSIRVPALPERPADVPVIAERLLAADVDAGLTPDSRAWSAAWAQEPPLATLRQTERAHAARVLNAVGWTKNEAARMLGVNRGRLYRKIGDHGPTPPDTWRGPVTGRGRTRTGSAG